MTRVPETATPDRGHWGILERTPVIALRVVQFGLDVALLALITLIPVTGLLLILPRNPDGTLGALLIAIPAVIVLLVGCVVISWWYFAWEPARRAGQTFAMRLLRLQVVGGDGLPVTRTQLTVRWLLLVVDAMFVGLVGLTAMLLSAKDQRIGDTMAQTYVVRTRP
jgi:uncharacterized RDD family membrane protein YckC